jgi:hypothetical protein
MRKECVIVPLEEQQVVGQAEQKKRSPLATTAIDIKMNESVGTVFLGILAVILLVALLRTRARDAQQPE